MLQHAVDAENRIPCEGESKIYKERKKIIIMLFNTVTTPSTDDVYFSKYIYIYIYKKGGVERENGK